MISLLMRVVAVAIVGVVALHDCQRLSLPQALQPRLLSLLLLALATVAVAVVVVASVVSVGRLNFERGQKHHTCSSSSSESPDWATRTRALHALVWASTTMLQKNVAA